MGKGRLCSGEPGRWSLVILLVVFSCFILCLASCSRQPVYPGPSVREADVVIDTGTLGNEKPVFFTFPYHGRKINFFVFRTGEKVLSFLDACASCYSSKLGYRAGDGSVTCRKCDLRYSLSNIEKGFGNCFPIAIEGYLKGREYRIPVSRLQEAQDKF
jgi:uncharacterized membrane protein